MVFGSPARVKTRPSASAQLDAVLDLSETPCLPVIEVQKMAREVQRMRKSSFLLRSCEMGATFFGLVSHVFFLLLPVFWVSPQHRRIIPPGHARLCQGPAAGWYDLFVSWWKKSQRLASRLGSGECKVTEQ